jgi:Zn finger protein HypA/HybF involved in hydrogenase expression
MVSCKWKCLDCGNTFKTETDVVRVFGEECPRCRGINLDLISVSSKKDNRTTKTTRRTPKEEK